MSRLDNWQTNLTKLIEEYKEKPFEFKSHNCLLWAGLATKAVTGKNVAIDVIGQYTTETSALKYLNKTHKVKTVEDFLKKQLDQDECPIAFARAGDIVLMDYDNSNVESVSCGRMFGRVPGICYGVNSYFLGEAGLVEVKTLLLDSALWVS